MSQLALDPRKKKNPKNATVTITTTVVVDHFVARDGQLTCRISTRTSWMNCLSRSG